MQNKKLVTLFYSLAFIAGAFIGFIFYSFATWADFEASMFDPTLGTDETLSSMRCPVMIAPGETGLIHATIKNDADKKVNRRLRTHISAGLVTYMDEYVENLTLAPGESQRFQWEFSSEDAVWDRFVLARVTLMRSYPYPSKSGTCGIQVVDLFGLPGGVLTALAASLSIMLMTGGIYLRKRMENNAFQNLLSITNFMIVLTIFECAGILAVLAGNWPLSGLATILTFLLCLVAAAHFTLNTKPKTH